MRQPDGVQLSYRALVTRSTALGRVLRREAGAEARIGILLPNIAALPVTFWHCKALASCPRC